MTVPHASEPIAKPNRPVRLIFVLVGLALWYSTQTLIGSRVIEGDAPVDFLLVWSAPANRFLHSHPVAADLLLIVSSLVIDVLGLYLLVSSIFGSTIRPFLGLLILFSLRQVCQAVCALPAPPDMIWHTPHLPDVLGGFKIPSLLVTYPVANDFFFSGHTALAVYGAIELARLGRRWTAVAVVIACFEVVVVLILRAHWTMDVFAAIVTAFLTAHIADRLAPLCDRWLSRSSS